MLEAEFTNVATIVRVFDSFPGEQETRVGGRVRRFGAALFQSARGPKRCVPPLCTALEGAWVEMFWTKLRYRRSLSS